MSFDYNLDFKAIDFRDFPFLYKVGKGEQGVLLVEPYKSELLPYWRFRIPKEADQSAKKIYRLFQGYKNDGDFVGMDMARKFLQMGFTRSRRYANHKSGKKYDGPVPHDKKGQSGAHGRVILPDEEDPIKAESAKIFFRYWKKVEADSVYKKQKEEWKIWYG